MHGLVCVCVFCFEKKDSRSAAPRVSGQDGPALLAETSGKRECRMYSAKT